MKNFFKYLVSVICLVIILLLLVDAIYTNVYSNYYSNSKFQFFRSFKNKNVDYVFLGSSRVENGINPLVIDSITNSKSVNFSVQSSKVNDMLLLLKLLDVYNIKYKKVFIQIDYIYNSLNEYSNVLDYELIPFYNSNDLIKKHLNSSNKYNDFELSFPFMRYALYDQKNGIRRLISNFKTTASIYSHNNGFRELHGTLGLDIRTHDLPNKIIDFNQNFEDLKAYISSNNIDVVYFFSPIRKDTKNKDYVDKLKLKIPELKDYSSVIENSKYFKDNIHLNKHGAKIFSAKMANDILLNDFY